MVAVPVALLAIGLAHRPTVLANHRAMADAIARAQAYIGDRAPAEFRRNLRLVSTFAIEPGRIYRTCVPSARTAARYCVIVKTRPAVRAERQLRRLRAATRSSAQGTVVTRAASAGD